VIVVDDGAVPAPLDFAGRCSPSSCAGLPGRSRSGDPVLRTRYANKGDLSIAYPVIGSGDVDPAELDVRDVLGAIHVPTLVLHRRGDRLIDVSVGGYPGEHVPGARYVELDGDDHIPGSRALFAAAA
jgi:pimeloyl-ACP methyl ester carboxylesterase